jgi:hypothetical protein
MSFYGSRPNTGASYHSGSGSRASTPSGSSERPSGVKKQSSFASLSSIFNKSNSNSSIGMSSKEARRAGSPPPAPPPPVTLGRQDLKEYLLKQDSNPSLQGVVRLGNICYQEIAGKGLIPRSPEMCHHTALLFEWANQRNGQLLTPEEQKKLGYCHYAAWCNSGIVAEVCGDLCVQTYCAM